MAMIDPITKAIRKVASLLIGLLPGPPSDQHPPDVD